MFNYKETLQAMRKARASMQAELDKPRSSHRRTARARGKCVADKTHYETLCPSPPSNLPGWQEDCSESKKGQAEDFC